MKIKKFVSANDKLFYTTDHTDGETSFWKLTAQDKEDPQEFVIAKKIITSDYEKRGYDFGDVGVQMYQGLSLTTTRILKKNIKGKAMKQINVICTIPNDTINELYC